MFVSAGYAEDLAASDIENAIAKPLVHPYVFFSAEDKSAILARIENDPVFGDIFRRQLAEANRLIHSPVDREAPKRYTNARFEGVYANEAFLASNSGAAYTLAFCYQMTGDERYAAKAFEFADVVCDQPTWVHSVHEFPDIYDRVWPWGARDDQPAFSYSQHIDHYVFQLAAVYDWLYPALDRRQRDRIRGALLEKAILRVRGNYEYHWWAAAYRCNWCAVCNSSLGVASIALLTEDPNLTDVIAESWNRIGKTLDEIGSGGWQEGIGYLTYTIRTSLTFADVLKRATSGRLNMYEHPRFDDAVKTLLYCQFPNGKSVHFGDSAGGSVAEYRSLNDLMLERGDLTAAWLRDNLGAGNPTSPGDIFKPRSDLKPSIPSVASMHFPVVNWVVMRSDFDNPSTVAIAAKCGMHDDPHHGHLDAGHFSLYWKGCEFICDNGSPGYDKEYFDEARWSYPFAATIGHNCVMVNGEQQMTCKLKNQPWDLRYGGEIIEFAPGPDRDYVLMDPSNAYPKKEFTSWRRHILLDKPDITVVVDDIACPKGAEIEARFHSAARQTVRERYVLLDNNGDRMAVIPVTMGGAFEIRGGSHTILLAQRNASMRQVPYFGTVVGAQSGRTVVAVVILPVADDNAAKEIAGSMRGEMDGDGNMSISFTDDSRQRRYSIPLNSGR